MSLPADGLGVVLHPAEPEPLGGPGTPRHEQHLTPQHRVGDLEEELLIHPMNDEEARVADRLLRYHLAVRLDLLLVFAVLGLLLRRTVLRGRRLARAKPDRASGQADEQQARGHGGRPVFPPLS